MTSANHIAGGIALTGIGAGLYDVNIFSHYSYLGLTVACCLLPDIDHPKSIAGTLFRPVSRRLFERFGHRTLTHSLLFFLPVLLLLGLASKTLTGGFDLLLIGGFAWTSHLLLDMVTKQGIMLLWPWLRNPCVLPGNPEARIRTGNLKTEMIAFGFFVALSITCYPLMKRGFWTSYNREFGKLKHLNREFMGTTDQLKVEYSYYDDQATHHQGTGLLVASKPESCVLFQDGRMIYLNKHTRYDYVRPVHTDKKYRIETQRFSGISEDSLRRLLEGKIITQCDIETTGLFEFKRQGTSQTSKSIHWENTYNPTFQASSDTLSSSLQTAILQVKAKLTETTLKIEELKKKDKAQRAEQQKIIGTIRYFKTRYPKAGNYEKEKIIRKLNNWKKKRDNFQLVEYDTSVLQLQRNQLKEQIEELTNQLEKNGEIRFTGQVKHLLDSN